LNVGKLVSIRKEDFKFLCDRIEQKVKGENPIFSNMPDNVEKEAEFIYRRILHENLLDCKTDTASCDIEEKSESTDIQNVDVNSISNEDSRSFGGEWLSKQMLDSCGLSEFLSQNIDNEDMAKRIEIEIISRMVHPSSELETSRWLESESSLCEILSVH
jgi:hypothetical protein